MGAIDDLRYLCFGREWNSRMQNYGKTGWTAQEQSNSVTNTQLKRVSTSLILILQAWTIVL